jgi:hypothetical protein
VSPNCICGHGGEEHFDGTDALGTACARCDCEAFVDGGHSLILALEAQLKSLTEERDAAFAASDDQYAKANRAAKELKSLTEENERLRQEVRDLQRAMRPRSEPPVPDDALSPIDSPLAQEEKE